jgi:putative flippase GtrA
MDKATLEADLAKALAEFKAHAWLRYVLAGVVGGIVTEVLHHLFTRGG